MENIHDGNNSFDFGNGRTGKRKADSGPVTDKETQERPPTKKRHATALQIVDMPKGLLFKMFALLEPLDLLHIARTTKSLRKLLMTRSSISVWKVARSNVPGPQHRGEPRMPDCPTDLTEPQYAKLVFENDCYFCDRNVDYRGRQSWTARLRACYECLNNDNYFVFESDCKISKDSPPDLIRCLPKLPVSPIYFRKGGGPLPQVIPIKIMVLWEEEYKGARKKKEWMHQHKEKQNIIRQHAKACEAWLDYLYYYRREQHLTLIKQRRAAVVKYFKKLGWGEELSKMPESAKMPQDDSIVTAACQEPLTENVLSGLDAFINEFMGDVKSKRLLRERRAFLAISLPEFKQLYDTFLSKLPGGALYPFVSDAFQDPVIRSIIDSDTTPCVPGCTTNHFDWVASLFPAVIRRWQRSIEDKLSALVVAACGDKYTIDPGTVLDLATVWFTCSKCDIVLRYPRVLVHDCATSVNMDCVDHLNPDVVREVVKKLFRRVPWNSLGHIKFELKTLACMTSVLVLCRLDPKTTTAQEMDAAKHVFECVTCNDPYEGRPTMTWSRVLDHWKRMERTRHSGEGGMRIGLLGDQEMNLVQAQFRDIRARRIAKLDYKGLICSHCKLAGNVVDLTKHLGACHARPQPTDKDIVPVVDDDHGPDIYWLWPPRKEPAPTSRLSGSGDGIATERLSEEDMYL